MSRLCLKLIGMDTNLTKADTPRTRDQLSKGTGWLTCPALESVTKGCWFTVTQALGDLLYGEFTAE
jgi:hypothetical protein